MLILLLYFLAMNYAAIMEKLSHFTVGIAGAGGLGSNCAVALARVGIGRLILADFDVVSSSNLNRQYYFCDQLGKLKVDALRENIARINPQVQIDTYAEKLTKSNIPDRFKNCDVIVEAFDLAEMKQMIAEICMESMPNIPLIMGVGMAGWGDSQSIRIQTFGNLYVCGDQKSEIADDMPPLGPRVAMVANMQANTVLEILLKK